MTNTIVYTLKLAFLGNLGKYLLIILPIILSFMFFYLFWVIRFRWLTMTFIDKQPKCLLELRLPKEITKSPAAMEVFFYYLSQRGADNYGEAYLDGKTRAWFSCEIVSTGGSVRFFIWCSEAKYRNIVEAQLYAQYPNLEIIEVDDYTKGFYFDPESYPLAGAQYTLKQPDPYPIKTYIDYGLDEDQKEEYKIDPITSVLEYMGSLKKGENAWMQILVRRHEKESWEHGVLRLKVDPKKANFIEKILISLFGQSRDLKAEVEKEIQKIKKSTLPKTEKGDDDKIMKFPNPTKGQQEVIAALERSATKTPFDCMIRSIYISEKSSFSTNSIRGLISGLKQYGSLNLNSFRPDVTADEKREWINDFGRIFPFVQRLIDNQKNRRKKDLLYAYKLRSYFQYPYQNYGGSKPFVLTSEELATIFHFPSGMVSQTPTLHRVGSKKSEAPANLPI